MTGIKPEVIFRRRFLYKGKMKKEINATDWAKLIDSIVTSNERNKMLLDIAITNPTHKFIYLSERFKHVTFLDQYFKSNGVECDYMAGAKKTYKDSRVLLGTIGKIGTGFDEKNFCPDFKGIRADSIVICTSIKNKNRLEQSVGRIRAEYKSVIHLVDDNKLINEKHWGECVKWYTSRNGSITDYIPPKKASDDIIIIDNKNQQTTAKDLVIISK